MSNLNNNEITVRFSFLTSGSKLSANYKPRTGNYTFSGTVIEHEDLDVSHNRINSVVVSNEAKGGRATLCFTSREEASKYIKMINTVLAVNAEAQIKVLTTNQIIYNNVDGKSLTIFNPDVIELDEIKKPVIDSVGRRTASLEETVPFNYEEAFISAESRAFTTAKEVELNRVAPQNEYGTRNYRKVREFEKSLKTHTVPASVPTTPVVNRPSQLLTKLGADDSLNQEGREDVEPPVRRLVEPKPIDEQLVALVLKHVGPVEFSRMSKEDRANLLEGLRLCV